uniref:SUZ domain-containing protein n=1 Tax=Heterorhabditis bacteriophora TaxID=37862 RepID=A0A1I7WBR4_HETBA
MNSPCSSGEKVRLNVGGIIFETTVTTLTRFTGTFYNLLGLAELCGPHPLAMGDEVQWRVEAVPIYWRPFVRYMVDDSLSLPFIYDRNNHTLARCIACEEFQDPKCSYLFDINYSDWEPMRHHMLTMRGEITQLIFVLFLKLILLIFTPFMNSFIFITEISIGLSIATFEELTRYIVYFLCSYSLWTIYIQISVWSTPTRRVLNSGGYSVLSSNEWRNRHRSIIYVVSFRFNFKTNADEMQLDFFKGQFCHFYSLFYNPCKVRILQRAQADKEARKERAKCQEELRAATRRPKSGDQLKEGDQKDVREEIEERSRKTKTLEERQAAYDEARNRILGFDYKPDIANTGSVAVVNR